MEPDDIQEGLVEKFVSGEMEGSELAAFEARIAAEPELAAEVELERMALEAIREAGAMEIGEMLERIHLATPNELMKEEESEEQEVEEAPDSNGDQQKEKRPKTIDFGNWRSVAVAAAVVLLGVVGFIIVNSLGPGEGPNHGELFAMNFEPMDDMVSGKAPDSNLVLQGLELYNEKEWKDAAEIFVEVLPTNKYHTLARIYEGICYLNLKDADKAIPPLESAMEKQDPLHNDAATWYFALANLLKGNIPETRGLLEGLKAADAPKWGEKAADLLKKMEDLE